MCNYLTKRGATYYFRRVIPDDVRPAFDSRKEWVFTLGTKDRREGERKARLEAVRYDGIIADARAKLTGSQAGPIDASAPPVAKHPGWHSQAEFEHFLEQAAHDQQLEWEEEERWPELDALKVRLQEPDGRLSPRERAIKDLLAHNRFEWTLAAEKEASR